MAKTKISEFSTTPGNNTDINGINISEGCAPSGINNAIRELMSDLKEWQSGAMDVYVIPQGSIASPGLQLYGDLDTGFYGDAANQLGVAVGGSSVGYFSASGWVGNVVAQTIDLVNIEVTNIKAKDGTTSISLADSTGIATFSKATVIETTDNTNAALRITQLGTGNALLVEDATNPDTTPTVIDQFGNVILGTTTRTTPITSKVEIHSTSTDGAGLTPSLGFYNWSATATTASALTFRHYPSGTVGTLAANTSGDVLGRIVFLSYDGTNAFGAVIRGVSGAGGTTPSITYDASGGHNFTSGPIDVENLEVTNIKARDGTAAASIADSTGVMTIASSVLTTTDINGGTIDGAVIGGSSAAAGTFTTITGTQVNGDNLRLDGNTLSSTDTNGNIVVAPNGTGITTFSNYLKTGNLEVGQAALGTNLIKATNTNGGIYLQTNGTGLIFADAASIIAGNASATTKITTNGASDLVLDTNDGSNSGSITIQDGVNGNILISPNGTGQIQLSGALDVTNLEVTNIKAKDGTAALSIADSTGAVTVSTALTANGGAVFNENGADVDLRVEGDTDVNLLFVDASTDRVGIGTNAPIGKLDVAEVNFANIARFSRNITGTNSVGSAARIRTSTTGDMVDGFGTGLVFSIEDNAAVQNDIAFINAVRTGADNTGSLTFSTVSAGTSTEKLRITSGGQVNIGGNFTSTNNTLQVTGNAAIGYTTAAPTTGLIVAGNVGIGTSSPAAILATSKSSSTQATGLLLRNPDGTTGSSISIDFEASTGTSGLEAALAGRISGVRVGSGTTGALDFFTTNSGTLGSAKMRLDSSGNLGLGVTPSAWAATAKTLDFAYPSFAMDTTGAAIVGFNAYNSSGTTWTYKTTDEAALFTITTGGAFTWRQAASGTAGNAITFTQAMTLDASGNLLVGATSALLSAASRGNITLNGTTDAVLTFGNNAATAGYIYSASTRLELDAAGARYMQFNTNGTERARITSGGYFKASNTGTYVSSTGGYHEFLTNSTADFAINVRSTASATGNFGINITYPNRTPNNTGNVFFACVDSTATRAEIRSNGGLANYSANNVDLASDRRLKNTIEPMRSYYDVFKNINWVTWLYNDQTDDLKNHGVIAQELQELAPEFVCESNAKEAPEGEAPYLGIWEQDFKMAGMSVITELIKKIEKLEAEVAALKGV